MNGWCVDAEANNLYLQASKIWYIRFKTLDGSRSMKVYPFKETKEETYQKIMEWVNSFDDGALVVSFNGLGYDHFLLWKLLGLKPRVGKKGKDWIEDKQVQFYDCYVCSQYLSPDSPFHSLEYLSRGTENEKMAYRQKLIELGAMKKDDPKGFEFSFYHTLMDQYCDEDVDATIGVFNRQWTKAVEMYGEDKWIHPSFRQMQKDYFLYSAQAYSGAPFHQERARKLVAHVEVEMAKLKAEVDPKLPARPLKTAEQAFYKMPAKPYAKNGDQSAALKKWLEKHNATLDEEGFVHAYELKQKLVANDILDVKLPMEIEDNAELKNWFMENGWIAADGFWNFKKDPLTGKPMRDTATGQLVKTTPKIQHQGQICPNLLKLEGEIPSKVVKFLSYRNRLGVVTGWLNNWRMEFDGRLSAEISGYAPTSRVKHRTLVNCPKASDNILLGAEMRDLFYAPEGYWYVGTDAAALENRTLSHHTFKYDNGAFAKMQLEGDPHSFNAFAFFPALLKQFDINNPENKEDHKFKPWRNKAKTGAYLLAFGGGAPKLASSLGLSKSEGKRAYDSYWEKNLGLGKLKEAAEKYYTTTGKNKYIPGIDGRLISVRGKNVLLSCLGQGTGAVAMSYAGCFMDAWLGEMYLDDLGRPYYEYKGRKIIRISFIHDEYSWLVEDGVQDDIRIMSEKAIVEAGKFLKLALPLAAEGKMSFQGSWKDVH